MSKIVKSVFSIFFIMAVYAGPAAAFEFKPFVDNANKYEVSFPLEWNILRDENYQIQFENNRGSAHFGIMVEDLGAKVPAMVFLKEIEKSLKQKNSLPENERKLTPDQLKMVNADDSYSGLYSIGEKEALVRQKYLVLSKGNKAYIIITTVLDAERAEHNETFESIIKSFKIK